MENKGLVSNNPSIMLWLAAAVVAVLGMRAFLEYLRRVNHEGPKAGWRDLAFASGVLPLCVWSTVVVAIAGQGLTYLVGYHPLRLFGTLVLAMLFTSAVIFWVAARPGWLSLGAGSTLLALLALATQVGVVYSVGTEPGLHWRWELLVFSLLVMVAGHGVAMRVVLAAERGRKSDRGGRRMLGALLGAVALVGAQELTLLSANLPGQSISAFNRMLPEVAVALLAGAAVPIGFAVMIVDQYMQRRIRRASRRRVGGGRTRIGHEGDAGPTTHASGLPSTTSAPTADPRSASH